MPPMKNSLPSAEAGRLDNTPKRAVIQTRIITCWLKKGTIWLDIQNTHSRRS